MADENIVEQTTTEQVVQTPEPVVEQVDAEPAESQETVEPEKADQETEKPPEPETQPEVKKYKLKVNGQEEEHDENELVELAQKGIAFSKKQQDLIDWEKANQFKIQGFEQMVADPQVVKALFARQMGIDPAVVLQNIQPPDPQYKEQYPEWFYQQQSAYDKAMMQRESVEKSVQQFVKQSSDGTNLALLAKAKITHDLTEDQALEVGKFVAERMRPGMFGIYNEKDMDAAVMALYGKSKAEQDKLNTANNIKETIKRGVKTAPARATTQRSEELAPDVAEARHFLEHIREMNASK